MVLKTLISAVLGTIGFALMFKIDLKRLAPAALEGLLACGLYLYFNSLGVGLFFSNFIAAAISAVMAEIFARIFRAPAAIFLLPSAIPLVPGGMLYRTMIGFIFKNYTQAIENGKGALLTGLGIAAGMIASSVVCGIIIRSIDKYTAEKKAKQKT